MYSFLNDYNEIAHERILNAIIENNYVQTYGYGEDEFCENAKNIIKQKFECENSDIYFFMAGTQTNLTIIDYMLKSYEGIIATDTAHISVHEASAIEACGHKIMTVPNKNGKLLPQQIEKIYTKHLSDDHMTLPKAVYISETTELGTIYKKQELVDIYNVCKKYGLYLFVDGARLGSALTARENDIKITDLSKYSDVFYIGGTKNGAMLGEALVINNEYLKPNFVRQMKCKGSIYAKGKVQGIEFYELFKDDLYFELARHSNDMAYKIYDSLKDDYEFLEKVQSNQIFMILKNDILEELGKEFVFSKVESIDENKTSIRLVTSWATKEEEVDKLIKFLKKYI